MVFGTSSPSTMCSAVMPMNAIATATVCAVAREIMGGSDENAGSMIVATAGSPTQPSPRLAIVMPSCVAAMKFVGLSSARRTGRARRLPSAMS